MKQLSNVATLSNHHHYSHNYLPDLIFLHLYAEETYKSVAAANVSFTRPRFDHCSTTCKDFIRYLLTKDLTQRPSAREALLHPWLTESCTLGATPYVGMSSSTHSVSSVSASSHKKDKKGKSSPPVVDGHTSSKVDVVARLSPAVITQLFEYVNYSLLKRLFMNTLSHAMSTSKSFKDLLPYYYLFDSQGNGYLTMEQFHDKLMRYIPDYAQYVNSTRCSNPVLNNNETDMREGDLQSVCKTLFRSISISGSEQMIGYHELMAAMINIKDVREEYLIIAFDMLSFHTDRITLVGVRDLLGVDGTSDVVHGMWREAQVASCTEDGLTMEEVSYRGNTMR